MTKSFQISMTPQQLWQKINPWTLNLQGSELGVININLGRTPLPELERDILDEVGSYGRQLGHIGDVLEVLLRHVDLGEISKADQDALDLFKGDLAQIRQIKQRLEKRTSRGCSPD